MGMFDFFKSQRERIDPLADLVVAKLRPGYIVDYDMESWEVTSYAVYDLGDGYEIEEWGLRSGTRTRYLERYEDDEVELCLSEKVPIGAIEGDIRGHIKEHDDPPAQIVYKGKTYFEDETDSGHYFKDGKPPGTPFISWTYIDEEDESFVAIEQWGENEFEAAAGIYVEEYQFSNILPGSTTS